MSDSDLEPAFSPLANQSGNRNWAPMAAVAVVVLVLIFLGAFFLAERTGKPGDSSPGDPNLAKLKISDLHMATAQNFVGGSVTYIEGKIANGSDRKVTSARVEAVFKNSLGETVQKETLAVAVLLQSLPYIDYGPIDRAPLAAGQTRDFRLTLEHVSADWDGQLPQVRVVAIGY